MVLAEGGTAGPPTGPHDRGGALEDDRRARGRTRPTTRSCGPSRATSAGGRRATARSSRIRAGRWWMVYHAYENGYYTLGRQTLLEPIEWTADGWFRAAGARSRASRSRRPAGTGGPHGMALSDDFSDQPDGRAVEFLQGSRCRRGAVSLRERRARAEGEGHVDPPTAHRSGSSPAITPTRSKWRSTPTRVPRAGLLVFYSRKLYAGLGLSAKNFVMHSYGMDRTQRSRGVDSAPSVIRSCETTATS